MLVCFPDSTPVGVSVSNELASRSALFDYRYYAVGGAVLAWGIIAPSLVKTGVAVASHPYEDFPDLASSLGMVFNDIERYTESPSARYWLLWPGVFIMIVYSFADIIVSLIPAFKGTQSSSFTLFAMTYIFPRCQDQQGRFRPQEVVQAGVG